MHHPLFSPPPSHRTIIINYQQSHISFSFLMMIDGIHHSRIWQNDMRHFDFDAVQCRRRRSIPDVYWCWISPSIEYIKLRILHVPFWYVELKHQIGGNESVFGISWSPGWHWPFILRHPFSGGNGMVLFHQTWCGHCRRFMPWVRMKAAGAFFSVPTIPAS